MFLSPFLNGVTIDNTLIPQSINSLLGFLCEKLVALKQEMMKEKAMR